MSFATNFVPSGQIISNITKASPGVVTTVANHGYLTGLIVRLVVPLIYGMQQVNGQIYQITVLSSNTFSLDVSTANFDSFVPGSQSQSPQVIPVGNIQKGLLQPEDNAGNIIPEV